MAPVSPEIRRALPLIAVVSASSGSFLVAAVWSLATEPPKSGDVYSPIHARRGIGRALIERAEIWAREHDLPALTLTTYVEVLWNGPYYERLGFHYLTSDQETQGLRSIRDHERQSGLDAWPRACMRRDLESPK